MYLGHLPLAIVFQFTFDNSVPVAIVTYFETKKSTSTYNTYCLAWDIWSDNTNHDEPIINLALLIFKLHVYSSSEKHVLNIMDLPHKRNKKTEYRLSSNC